MGLAVFCWSLAYLANAKLVPLQCGVPTTAAHMFNMKSCGQAHVNHASNAV